MEEFDEVQEMRQITPYKQKNPLIHYSRYLGSKGFIKSRWGMQLALAVGLLMRGVFFQGFLGVGAAHDDIYAQKAYAVASNWKAGVWRAHVGSIDPLEMRIGIVIPTAFSFYLFGVSEISATLYPMLCSFLNLWLIGRLGQMLFDQQTGTFSSLLLAIFPLDVLFASVLWPDVSMCTFMLLSVFCFVIARQQEDIRKKRWSILLCGFCVGCAYNSKDSGLLILSLFFFYFLKDRVRFEAWICLLGGLLMAFLLEGAFLYLNTGDPLARVQFFRPLINGSPQSSVFPGVIDYEQLPTRILWTFPSMMFNPFNRKIIYFGLFEWAFLIAAAYGICRKDSSIYFVLAWWGLMFLAIDLAPFSLSPLVLLHNAKPAYLLPLVFPTVLAIARSLLMWTVSRKAILAASLFTIFISSVVGSLLGSYASGRNIAYNSRVIASYIEEHPPSVPVYADPGTRSNLEFFLKYRCRFLKEYHETDLSRVMSGLVVIDYAMLDRKLKDYDVPSLVLDPPDNWHKLQEIQNPAFESTLFKTFKRILLFFAGRYAAVSSSGVWGIPEDQRRLEQVLQDFQKPAVIYEIKKPDLKM